MLKGNEYKNVCDNIRWLRRQRGLSRTATAKKLHIALKTLDLLESGVFPERINIGIFFYVHQVFGVSPNTLLTRRIGEE